MANNASQQDMLIVSSEILAILKSELSARDVKPTPENLRWVMEIIEKSLPAFSAELLI